jgi:hypothetical protein
VVSFLVEVPLLVVEPFLEVPSYLEVAFSFLVEASYQEEEDVTYQEASLVRALEVSLAFLELQHLYQDQLTQVELITS